MATDKKPKDAKELVDIDDLDQLIFGIMDAEEEFKATVKGIGAGRMHTGDDIADWALANFGLGYRKPKETADKLKKELASASGQLVMLVQDYKEGDHKGIAVHRNYLKIWIAVATQEGLVVEPHPYRDAQLPQEPPRIADDASEKERVYFIGLFADRLAYSRGIEDVKKHPLVLSLSTSGADGIYHETYDRLAAAIKRGYAKADGKMAVEVPYLDAGIFSNLEYDDDIFKAATSIPVDSFHGLRERPDRMIGVKIIAGSGRVLQELAEITEDKHVLKAESVQDVYRIRMTPKPR
jgi:hypothetical protein